MVFNWDNEKNNSLKASRGIGFERIVVAIEEGHLLDILEHPNEEKYPNQEILIVEIDDYICVVPCVVNEDVYFLKTLFRNRKYTDLYLPGRRRRK